jgi:hypothetical protein
MSWVVNHVEPECSEEAPSRLALKGRAYRRRHKHHTTIATLCGTVAVWRRLYEPLAPGARSLHPLELRLGIAVGVEPPALACRGRVPRCASSWVVRGQGWRHIARPHRSIRSSAGYTRHGLRKADGSQPSPWAVMASMCRCATGHGRRGNRDLVGIGPPWQSRGDGVPGPEARVGPDTFERAIDRPPPGPLEPSRLARPPLGLYQR